MNNYMEFSEFVEALNNAALCKVSDDGTIMLYGLKYEHEDLLPYRSQYVKAFTQLDGIQAVCFTPFDKEFICNAHNRELWAAMMEG